jgi:EmrB/QacA subfamily drug resistance transporter
MDSAKAQSSVTIFSEPQPRQPLVTPRGKKLLPWLVAVAFFMESLDTTILNTAVPVVSEALHVSPLAMKSVLASYTLSLAVFIPISGWMADRFGTRRVFASAMGLFTLGSFLCGIANDIHLLVACRLLQGCGGAMMVPVGRLTLVRSFAKSELIQAMNFVAIPALIGPMLGPLSGGLIVGYLHWRFIFFLNLPIGILGLLLVYFHLPDYREAKASPIDIVGLILFGSGVALLSYVLEIFGEHTLGTREILGLLAIALSLLVGYGLHAVGSAFPLLQMRLFGRRTFRVAVSGSFLTRIGVGGVPFLLPLLYQVGLGFTPVQSGLLIMPQAMGAMCSKTVVNRILRTFGYRGVLMSNTLMIAVLLFLFAEVGAHTPVWAIALLALIYGGFASIQYTSMNTLAYADLTESETSNGSSIASTMQQLSMSFGVATAGLATALFVPNRAAATPPQMIHGVHQALLSLGLLTILSSLLFRSLRPEDGSNVSSAKVIHPA